MEHCLVASPFHPVQAPSLLPPTHLHQCRVGCELQCDLHKAVLVFLAHDGDLDEEKREEGGSEGGRGKQREIGRGKEGDGRKVTEALSLPPSV